MYVLSLFENPETLKCSQDLQIRQHFTRACLKKKNQRDKNWLTTGPWGPGDPSPPSKPGSPYNAHDASRSVTAVHKINSRRWIEVTLWRKTNSAPGMTWLFTRNGQSVVNRERHNRAIYRYQTNWIFQLMLIIMWKTPFTLQATGGLSSRNMTNTVIIAFCGHRKVIVNNKYRKDVLHCRCSVHERQTPNSQA